MIMWRFIMGVGIGGDYPLSAGPCLLFWYACSLLTALS